MSIFFDQVFSEIGRLKDEMLTRFSPIASRLDPKQVWFETRLFVLGLDSPLGEFTSEAKCLWGECEGNLVPAAEGAWNRPLKKIRPKTGVTTLVLGLDRSGVLFGAAVPLLGLPQTALGLRRPWSR